MPKEYKIVANSERKKLIQLVHHQGLTISAAAAITKIYYPTAKAINKIYERELRVEKKKSGNPRKAKDKLCPSCKVINFSLIFSAIL